MSKKNNDPQQPSETIVEQPTVYDDLLANGTAILEAPTRDALAELVNGIPAECHYSVGAVGRNPVTGTFSLRVDVLS